MHLTPLRSGAERYYLRSLGLEPNDGSVPRSDTGVGSPEGLGDGHWVGKGAAWLGLSGPVQPLALASVLGGVEPVRGLPLGSRAEARRIAGWDVTAGAPKCLAVTWAFADEALGPALERAHRAACAEALAYLEDHAIRVRRRDGGAEQLLVTSGAVGAVFFHRLNRAHEPYLHSHIVLANAAQSPDGRWSGLDSRSLYAEAGAAGRVYVADLVHRLRTLGLDAESLPGGRVRLAGVAPSTEAGLSSRRAAVEDQLARWQAAGARAAGAAARTTRPAKRAPLPLDELRTRWDRLGERPDPGARWLPTGSGAAPGAPGELDPFVLALRAGGERGRMRRADVVAALCDASPGGLRRTEIERASAAFLSSPAVVAVEGRPGLERWEATEVVRAEGRLASSFRCAERGGAGWTVLAPGIPVSGAEDRVGALVRELAAAGRQVRGVAASPALALAGEAATGLPFAVGVRGWVAGDALVLLGADRLPLETLASIGRQSSGGLVVAVVVDGRAGRGRVLAETLPDPPYPPMAGEHPGEAPSPGGSRAGHGGGSPGRPTGVRVPLAERDVVLAADLAGVVEGCAATVAPRAAAGLPPLVVAPDVPTAALLESALRDELARLGVLGPALGAVVGGPGRAWRIGDMVRGVRAHEGQPLRHRARVLGTEGPRVVLELPGGVAVALRAEQLRDLGARPCWVVTPGEARWLGEEPALVHGSAAMLAGPGGDAGARGAPPPGDAGRSAIPTAGVSRVAHHVVAPPGLLAELARTGLAGGVLAEPPQVAGAEREPFESALPGAAGVGADGGRPGARAAARALEAALGVAADVARDPRVEELIGRPPPGVVARLAWREVAGAVLADSFGRDGSPHALARAAARADLRARLQRAEALERGSGRAAGRAPRLGSEVARARGLAPESERQGVPDRARDFGSLGLGR